MILAHKTISDDELLHHYALIPWEKLFDAQLQFEREISAILEPREGDDPWAEKQKVYIGLAKSKAILTLHESGNNAREIASQLGRSIATVNRHIQGGSDKNRQEPSLRNAEHKKISQAISYGPTMKYCNDRGSLHVCPDVRGLHHKELFIRPKNKVFANWFDSIEDALSTWDQLQLDYVKRLQTRFDNLVVFYLIPS